MAPKRSTTCSLCRLPPLADEEAKRYYVRVSACDTCPAWYHYECLGIETEEIPVVRKFVCPKCILEGKGQCEFAEELPEEWIGVNGGGVTEEQRKEVLGLLVSNVTDTIQEHVDELAAELACVDPDCKRLGVDEWAGFCSYECIEANMDLVMSKLDVDEQEVKIQRALHELPCDEEKLNADEETAQKTLHEVVRFRQALREFLLLINDVPPDDSLPMLARDRRIRREPALVTPVRNICMGFSQKDGKIIPCSKTKGNCKTKLHVMENELKAESKVCGYPSTFDKHYMRSSDPFPDKDALVQGDLCRLSRKVCVVHARWVENLLSIHELNWMRAVKSLEELKTRRELLKEGLRKNRPVMDPFSIFMDAVNHLHAETSARMEATKELAGVKVEPMEVDASFY